MTLDDLAMQLRAFAADRDWGQFHTPRSLLLALVGEVGELAALFQWQDDATILARMLTSGDKHEVERELADIAIYLVRLADVLEVDLGRAIADKIAENAQRYPADVVRGSAEKRSRNPST